MWSWLTFSLWDLNSAKSRMGSIYRPVLYLHVYGTCDVTPGLSGDWFFFNCRFSHNDTALDNFQFGSYDGLPIVSMSFRNALSGEREGEREKRESLANTIYIKVQSHCSKQAQFRRTRQQRRETGSRRDLVPKKGMLEIGSGLNLYQVMERRQRRPNVVPFKTSRWVSAGVPIIRWLKLEENNTQCPPRQIHHRGIAKVPLGAPSIEALHLSCAP
jgi:hypothetical protein